MATTTIERLIAALDRTAEDERLPVKVRSAARRDADGYRAAWAAKQA